MCGKSSEAIGGSEITASTCCLLGSGCRNTDGHPCGSPAGVSQPSALTEGDLVFTRKRFIAALGGSVLGLAAAALIGASPAAAATDLTLQPSQVGSTASGFPHQADDSGKP